MSLKTWKKEFYPESARRVAKKNALAHSLRKWLGLRPKALKKHGLIAGYRAIEDEEGGNYLEIDEDSCALCRWHISDEYNEPCTTCPLFVANGNKRCDGDGGPYGSFIDNGNPEPMIKLLEKAMREQPNA